MSAPARDRPARRGLRPAGVLGLLGLGLLLLVLATRRDRTLPVGAPIRLDDFAFTVLAAGPTADPAAPPPPGRALYAVTLRVDNNAKRVSFRFDPATVRLDVGPERLRPRPGPAVATLPKGTSHNARLVYEVPAAAPGPRTLRITTGGPVGDLIESAVAGRQRVRLP